MVKIARLDDAFSEIFELEGRSVEGQSTNFISKLKISKCSKMNFWQKSLGVNVTAYFEKLNSFFF